MNHTILGIEASSDYCTVALGIQGKILIQEAQGQRSHSQHLLPFVETLLKEGGIHLEQLDAIAFSAGPGSFTGIRLAASVVKTLAYAIQKPVIAISSLEVNAQTFFRCNPQFNEVTVINDARMQEVYWGQYSKGKNGLSEALVNDQLIKLNALPDVQSKVATGDAEALLIGSKIDAIPFIAQSPHAIDLLALSKRYYDNSEYTDALSAEPIYLRGKSSWKTLEQQKKAKK